MSRSRRHQQHDEALNHFFDTQTEALILGGILSGGEAVLRTVAFLSIGEFTLERHRIIFQAITDIALEVEPTLDAVAHRLDEAGKLEAAGGLTALVEIHAQAIPGLGLASFASKLRKKARDRRAFTLSEKLSVLCEQGFAANSSEVLAVADELQTIAEAPEAVGGVQSIRPVREYGDAKMPYVLDGVLYEETFNLLTGDSGHGKSTLA